MRIHVIIDPEHKIDNKLPPELIKKYDVRCGMIELADDFTAHEYKDKAAFLLDHMMSKPA